MLRSLRELIRYRLLVEYFVILDLKARYRGSALGFLWTLLNPLMIMVVMWVVFSAFGRVSEDNYALFLLSGLMAWQLFSESVNRSLNTIISNRGLMQLIYVPKIVFPVSIVCSSLVNLVFFFAAYLLIAAPTSHGIPWTVALLPVALVMLFMLSAGCGLLMAALTVFFRDFNHLTSPLMRALFYLSAIFYRPSSMGPKFELIMNFNPVYYPVTVTRAVMYDGVVPGLAFWGIGFGIAAGFLLLGLAVFTGTQERFVYYA